LSNGNSTSSRRHQESPWISPTVWSERDRREATLEQGRRTIENKVDLAVRFIERWKELRPRQ
jgi:hypothetical protein